MLEHNCDIIENNQSQEYQRDIDSEERKSEVKEKGPCSGPATSDKGQVYHENTWERFSRKANNMVDLTMDLTKKTNDKWSNHSVSGLKQWWYWP